MPLTSDTQPAIAGFYPDPSICRVGADYYLATSSFEYLPGIPIWHSRDLVNWSQVGNALDRPEQMGMPEMVRWLDGTAVQPPLPGGAANTGVYAPTLRFHGGRFWLAFTNSAEALDCQFVMSAERPEGPWSNPVRVRGLAGIDPDLAWDEAGVCHMTLASFAPDLSGVVSVEIDPSTGVVLSKPRRLWQGSGGAAPEGPHLYRRGIWWYLLLAEGGTERGHSITVARAPGLEGPWEPNPLNPILTRRGLKHPVQSTGHGDLVERPDGSWAMVYLGVRARGFTPSYHVNGRETFVAAIGWVDGWPVVDTTGLRVPSADHSFVDDFRSDRLDNRWISAGLHPREFAVTGDLGLTITTVNGSPRMLGVRTRDSQWQAKATIESLEGVGGLSVRLDRRHEASILLEKSHVLTRIRIGDLERLVDHGAIVEEGASLGVRAVEASGPVLERGPDVVELGIVTGDGWRVLAQLDGRYLSTEVAGGWTGRITGPLVEQGTMRVTRFVYVTIED
jgi:xylan 1,4-beta-xylosidase